MYLKLIAIFLSIELIYSQNAQFIFNKVLSEDDKNSIKPTKTSILNEILIDLTEGLIKSNYNLIERQISTSTITQKATILTKIQNIPFKNFSLTNSDISEIKSPCKINLLNSTNTNRSILGAPNNSTLKLIKNRDLKVFFKGTNLTTINKLAKGKYHSMFSIDIIYENNSYYTVIKINKELLVLLASIISVILIAFTIITCLYKMINVTTYKHDYHHCRYHKY
jgi:hypothetical protein